MKKEKIGFLAKGLVKGFAGYTDREQISRGDFDFETSHLEEDGARYHDEWIADRVGGGQEVIEVDGEKFTRLYAGGTVSLEELKRLELTKKDVIKYLIEKIQQLGDKTRLLEECEQDDGDWAYRYGLLDKESRIPVVVGKEVIEYKGEMVFVHDFLICPVE